MRLDRAAGERPSAGSITPEAPSPDSLAPEAPSPDSLAEAPSPDPLAPEALSPDPLTLLERLQALPVIVERVRARHTVVPVAGYGPGGRPSGIVELVGGRATGAGECVAWTVHDQERFAARCAGLLPPGTMTIGEASRRLHESAAHAYTTAALEGALLDLALRQRDTNPFDLCGVSPRPVRFLFSFAALSDPVGEARRVRSSVPDARLKLDVDPTWEDGVFHALSTTGGIQVLDLKLKGDLRLAERATAAVPTALIEDPLLSRDAGDPSAELRARLCYDAPVASVDDLETLPWRPAAVNVKPARAGGFLEALRIIAACRRAAIAVYVGGMFEVGPGRAQSQVLASLFSPEAWNDVAPIPPGEAEPWPSSPLAVPADFTGLGFDRGRIG